MPCTRTHPSLKQSRGGTPLPPTHQSSPRSFRRPPSSTTLSHRPTLWYRHHREYTRSRPSPRTTPPDTPSPPSLRSSRRSSRQMRERTRSAPKSRDTSRRRTTSSLTPPIRRQIPLDTRPEPTLHSSRRTSRRWPASTSSIRGCLRTGPGRRRCTRSDHSRCTCRADTPSALSPLLWLRTIQHRSTSSSPHRWP
jgi:hypothetical protein